MKKVIAFLISLVLIFGLAACGGTGTDGDGNGNNSGGSDGQEGNGDNAAGSNLDWSAGADASGGEVTLRIATWRQSDRPYYEEIISRFEETYDWITVDLDINADSSSYYTNLQADLMSGTAPDVFDLHPSDRLLAYAQDGIIAPQTDFDYMANYKEEAKKVTTINGVNYGYMNAYNYFGFIYNKKIFKAEGLEVPTTPEEFVAVVNKLKAAGYGGVVYAGRTYGSTALGSAAFLSRMGTEAYTAMQEGIDNGSVTDLSTVDGVADALDTLQFYTSNEIYYNAYESIDYDAGMSLFAQEKSAIIYSGSYALGEKATYFPDIDAGYFTLPVYGGTGVSYGEGAQTSAINVASKNLGAAKLWIEFLATAEMSEYFCSNAKMLSTIEGANVAFDEMEMLLSSSNGFALKQIVEPEHSEYWSSGYTKIMDGVVFDGEEWASLVKVYKSKLEEYDLANQ